MIQIAHIACWSVLGFAVGVPTSAETPKTSASPQAPSKAVPPSPPEAKAAPAKSAKGNKNARLAKRPASAKRSAPALARKVQAFYDKFEDYSAEFLQTYTRIALSRTTMSSGTLTLKKGGKVRWSYLQPVEKLFVSDGKTLWLYEPEEMQVIVQRNFSTERLGTSLAFLWGEGSLEKSFDLSIPPPNAHDLGKDAAVLQLVPKKDRTYKKLVIRVDEKTGRVDASVVHETSGNTNRFEFRNPKVNSGIPDARFQFVPPAGVDVVNGPS